MNQKDTVSQDLSHTAGSVTRAQSHTPGPWRVEKLRGGNNPHMGLWSVEGAGNVANDCTLADANLIAAALDLLAALKIAAQLAEQILHGNATPLGGAKLIADNSRAAIAKAEGPHPSSGSQR